MKEIKETNGRKKTKAQLIEEIRAEVAEEVRAELVNKLAKKQKLYDTLFTIFDTLAMLIFTAGGILIAKYIPAFKEGQDIILVLPSWGRLLIAFILAMGVMGVSEAKGNIIGKKKNWLRRAWFAIANGLGWFTLLGF